MAKASDDQRLRKGAATRERILEAATELFSSKGYSATRVGEIARLAGVEKAAFYWHFKSKESIFAEVIETIDTAWIEHIRDQVTGVSDADERLDRFIDGLKKLVANHSKTLRLMMNMALERSGDSKETRDATHRILERTSTTIQEEFASHLDEPLPDLDLIARLVLAYLFEAALRGAVAPDEVELDRFYDHLRRLIRHDIAAQIKQVRKKKARSS